MRVHPFTHAGLKAVSVALAILLWSMVSSQRAFVERGLRIPLELQNLPENLEMVEPPQESVDARVRGTADTISRLATGDLVATIDLSTAQPGLRLFHLSPERVKAPFAVDVTQVTPASVAIRFEASATRQVPVRPSVEGSPAPGFIVGKVSADPPIVEIVGPESVLRTVTEAITEPVWVGSAKTDVRAEVALGVADSGARLASTRSAVVTAAIVAAPEERNLTRVPVRTTNLAPGLSARIIPPTVAVRVRGSKQAIDRLKEASIVAYVDLQGIGAGDYGLPVRLDPPADIGVDELDPYLVNIHVQ
jgi:YbbR domain-containing protein